MKPSDFFLVHKFTFRALIALCSVLIASILFPTSAHAIDPNVRIAVAYDLGGLGDGGVNDATAIGINSVRKKYGLSNFALREVVTVGSESDRRDRLNFLAKAGYNLVVVAGSAWSSALASVAPDFPDIQFGIIGGNITGNVNVSVMTFNQLEESYVAGVLAASSSTTKKIGYISNSADSASSKSLAAFTAGARKVKKSVQVLSAIADSGAYSQTTQMVNAGADIIYSRWNTNSDVYSAVLSQSTKYKKKIKLIGIVPDQYFLNFSAAKKILLATINENYGIAISQLVTSALNNQTITDVIDEESGLFGRFFTIKNGGIAIKNFSASTQAISAANKARSEIISGAIKL